MPAEEEPSFWTPKIMVRANPVREQAWRKLEPVKFEFTAP